MKRALEGLLAEGEDFAVFSTALEGPGAWQVFDRPSRIAVGVSECTVWAVHSWGGDPPLYAAAPLARAECLAVEADGVVYTPAASLSSLVGRPEFLGFLIGEAPGAFRCRHLWPPAVAEGRRPVRLVRGGVGLTPTGAVRVLEFPEGYPAYYTRSVLRLYGLDGGHIAEPVYIPGGGVHVGEEFGVFVGDFLLLKSSRGVDYALNLILGVWGDKWIFLGEDGLYEGVFVHTGGEKGEVGYLKITAPFKEDVRLVEGPSYANFSLGEDLRSWPLGARGGCLHRVPEIRLESFDDVLLLVGWRLPAYFSRRGEVRFATPLLFADNAIYLYLGGAGWGHIGWYSINEGYLATPLVGVAKNPRIPLKPPRDCRVGKTCDIDIHWINAVGLPDYYSPLAERYKVARTSFFEPVYIPGGGVHVGEEFGVFVGDFLLLKSSRGVDYALNLILGVWGDKWIFLGEDGLYEGVFVHTGGEKGEVGYLKITAPYRGDARVVEGPPVIGEFLPRDCGFYSPLTGRCYSDRRLEVVRRWPLERIEVSAYTVVLEELLTGGGRPPPPATA
jgi:hypothetical protein